MKGFFIWLLYFAKQWQKKPKIFDLLLKLAERKIPLGLSTNTLVLLQMNASLSC